MSSSQSIPSSNKTTAPTPVNTPAQHAPISSGLSRPTVPDISEETGEELQTLGSAGMQSAMLGMVHGKLAGLVGRSSGYIEALPTATKRNVEGLKGIQVQQTELQNQYKRECLELERKYLGLQKPLYARRNAIIAGEAAATPEEIAAGEAQSLKDDEEYTPLPKEDEGDAPKGIPDFWLTALRNHPGLAELITERDAEALVFLKDVTLEYLPGKGEEGELFSIVFSSYHAFERPWGDAVVETWGEFAGKPGFTITFHWDADKNPFFENKTLSKTYIYQEEVGYGGDFVYDRAVGSDIVWKEEKDLTREWEIKKQRNKNTNRTRLIRKSHPTASFFNFFAPPVMPTDEAIENEEIDPEDLEEIEERLEVDYQIGEDFKEKIIPRAVDYFTGKALEYEILDDSDEDDDDFDELDDDEDDEGEFDEDSDSDGDVPARRRGPPKGRGAAAGSSGNVNPDECKQQ
ncbi:NAP-domain-containing protein [Mycena venus]|uniref:NAP-domain-containing protein n=1 Tax=Mycena venus TaxID=2733690 RepID=A0A8H7DBT7_9AGAR|nr:NAP-domain-containing protein [Mycena venus]